MDKKSATRETATASARSDRRTTILIVEDSPVQTELLRRALEGAGYQVVVASDGAEGLATAKESHPDAVVSDVNMPVMDGYAMCHAIRGDAILKQTPVILLTMLSDPLDVICGLNAGADAYVTKPYNVPTLVGRIESLLAYPPVPAPRLERRKVKIRLAGKSHLVDAHGPRMLNLLISTYENAVLQNRELAATQQALEELNQHLEQKVLQKTAELRESEQRFRALSENASDLVLVIDARGVITYVSPSVRRMGGYEPGELLGKSITAFIHPDDIPTALADLSALVHNPGTLHTTELRYRAKNGDSIILETVAKSAIDDPAINGIVINSRDITERRRADAAIAASETKYRSLFEAARDGILILDLQSGEIVDVNPFMIELLGYTREQYLGKKLSEIGPFKDTAAAEAAFAELQKTKYAHYENLPLRTADGRDIDVEFVSHAYRISGGEVIQCNIRDITERKRAEDALRESETRFRTLAEVSPTGIFRTDANGDCLYMNQKWCELSGLSEAEARGKGWIQAIHPDDRDGVVEAWYRSVREAARYRGEARFQHSTGRTVWHLVDSTAATDAAGKLIGYVGTVTDITERKRAEEDLRQLNWALRALGQSNSALVHAGNEKELFQTCCNAIAGSEGYPLAWIGLAIDDPAHSVAIAAAAGDAVTYLRDLEVSSDDAPHGSGPAGTAIRTGATQVANNLAECEAYLPWIERARARGLESAIALPIRADGGVLGALMIYGREVDAFGRAEVELFEELAADIGYGVASRRTLTQRDHLQQEQLRGVERLKVALIGTIGAVALTVEKRDPYTAGHQQRVAELCVAIGRKLELTEDRIEGLRLGATIHDIGKIYVPAEILNRPGKLSKPEFEIITSHPQVGYDIIKDVKFPWPVREMILQHHERLDGSGYPNGLKGDEIILEARILAVADVVEAMSSHRPYRPGLGLDSALAQVRQEAGTKLDTQVVDACERVFHEQGFSFSKA